MHVALARVTLTVGEETISSNLEGSLTRLGAKTGCGRLPSLLRTLTLWAEARYKGVIARRHVKSRENLLRFAASNGGDAEIMGMQKEYIALTLNHHSTQILQHPLARFNRRQELATHHFSLSSYLTHKPGTPKFSLQSFMSRDSNLTF